MYKTKDFEKIERDDFFWKDYVLNQAKGYFKGWVFYV